MKQIHNESGITLAELLAALAIGSIIIVMVTGIFVTFYKQYDKQSTQIRALANVTNAAQAITKDIRQAFDVEIAESKDRITLIFEDQTISYVFSDGELTKNGTVFLTEIEYFSVEKINQVIHLEIKGSADQQVETTIVLRKGGVINESNE